MSRKKATTTTGSTHIERPRRDEDQYHQHIADDRRGRKREYLRGDRGIERLGESYHGRVTRSVGADHLLIAIAWEQERRASGEACGEVFA